MHRMTHLFINELEKKISEHYSKKSLNGESRCYIGASRIGNSCDRRNWIGWKGFTLPVEFMDMEKESVRQKSFERGHREEERILNLLHELGYEISERQKEISHFNGDFKGHIDGIIKDEEGNSYVLEVKTMKQVYFNQVKKHGIRKVYHTYFIQIQMYMHFLNVPRGLFLILNKNDDSIYFEEIDIDSRAVEGTLKRVERIICYGEEMPARLGTENNIPYECKFCDFFRYCYKEENKNEFRS